MEDNYHLNIVLVRDDHQYKMHSTDSALFGVGVSLAVKSGTEPLNHLLHDNNLSHR